MKKRVVGIFIAMLCAVGAMAQQNGYIKSEEILSSLPEYAVAQEKIENLGKQYRSQVEAKLKSVEQLYNGYMAQKASLTQAQRNAKEEQIIAMEREAKELQKKYFGENGPLQTLTSDLMDPIWQKVQTAVDKVAKEKGFMFIFDLSMLQGVVYSDPKCDITQLVINALK